MSDSLQPHESQHARPRVHHKLPEFTQTHVHWIGDSNQPSHPLLSPSPPAPNPSQHQGLFQWVSGGSNDKEPTCQCRRQIRVQSLDWEDPLGKGLATHSSILAWRIPGTEEPGGLQSVGSHRVRHDWSDLACMHTHCHTVFLCPQG